MIRGRANPSHTVAAEERRHAAAGSAHGQIERAAAGERDTGGAGGSADRLDDGAVGATGGRGVRCNAVRSYSTGKSPSREYGSGDGPEFHFST